MNPMLPQTRDLVLIGGGHTHALILRKWGMKALAGARVTLINPGPTAPYTGMLPGFVAGHYGRDDLEIDLVKLTRFAGARLILGAASAIDPVAQTVTVPGRPPIAYDVASVDIGITSDMPDLSGFVEHGVPAKPLGPFATRWAAFREAANTPAIAVIGGGVAGVELAMAMGHALGGKARISVIDKDQVLAQTNPTGRRMLLETLTTQGIALIENATVALVGADHVALTDGRQIASDFTVGAAGARPYDWLANIGLDLHAGFIAVGPTLQSSNPAIFAVGDCAHLTHAPRPKAGVFAVRQAPVLFDNLRAALSGGDLRHYQPQKDYLKLVSLGDKSALAEKWGTARAGALLWRWKDRIDRKFMRQFTDLPVMDLPDVPLTTATGVRESLGDKPLCGGCGAKVGRGALRDVLAGLPPPDRADVLSVAGDDAAIVMVGQTRQVMTTDHLRALMADPGLMTRIAAIHALGDIWAMGASPHVATASIILPRLSADLQRRTLAEVMAVATEVMTAAGAAIVGGHSSLGDELTIGFTLTGLCDKPPITLAGAQPGDVLILTKPLGSGVIMAAEMAGQARGGAVAAAYAAMVQGQGAASAVLAGAHAMTDVTGFGLAGHLGGICAASGVGADVDLNAVPLMDGALELAQGGMKSTIFADNRSGAGPVFGADGPRADLLFDPQTAGGLLAAVDADTADDLLKQLCDAGYPAAIIGRITDGPPAVKVLR